MRERRGPLARATGIAEGMAAVVRRRQQDREPRVVLYDELGIAHVIPPDVRGYERLLDTCVKIVELLEEPGALARRTGARSGEAGGEEAE